MDKVESAILESENTRLLVWMRYIHDIFFIWTESEDELEGFLQGLNAFHPNLKFTHVKSEVSINFLDLTVSIIITFIVSPLTVINFWSLTKRILFITKNRFCIAKGCVLNGCAPRKIHLKNTLKVYVLGLAGVVIPKKLLTMKLGGFLKENQSSYLKDAQRLGLAYFLFKRIILGFIN